MVKILECNSKLFSFINLYSFRFTQQEQVLFKKRLERLDQKERQSFIHENGLSFETATVEARNDRKDFLLDLADVNIQNFHSTTFFKFVSYFFSSISLKSHSFYT
jgi:hypothetical protein